LSKQISDQEVWAYLQQVPPQEDIHEKDGALHIPILALENALDFFEWGTRAFQWQFYKEPNGSLGVAASLELTLSWENESGRNTILCFVGACNFALGSLAPNEDFLATAKSLCEKNAASDGGRRFGRGLNTEPVPSREKPADKKQGIKMQPDELILAQFKKAQEIGDDLQLTLLRNVYEFK